MDFHNELKTITFHFAIIIRYFFLKNKIEKNIQLKR